MAAASFFVAPHIPMLFAAIAANETQKRGNKKDKANSLAPGLTLTFKDVKGLKQAGDTPKKSKRNQLSQQRNISSFYP